jgi:methylmalonyl-CoA mutase N-terminal domain/subunit
VEAIEQGVSQRWIAASAYRIERETADGTRPRVGVNVYADTSEVSADVPELFALDPSVADRQVSRTAARVAARDQAACTGATASVEAAARGGANVMPSLVDAARAGATLGELSDVFRSVFGEFREPHPW